MRRRLAVVSSGAALSIGLLWYFSTAPDRAIKHEVARLKAIGIPMERSQVAGLEPPGTNGYDEIALAARELERIPYAIKSKFTFNYPPVVPSHDDLRVFELQFQKVEQHLKNAVVKDHIWRSPVGAGESLSAYPLKEPLKTLLRKAYFQAKFGEREAAVNSLQLAIDLCDKSANVHGMLDAPMVKALRPICESSIREIALLCQDDRPTLFLLLDLVGDYMPLPTFKNTFLLEPLDHLEYLSSTTLTLEHVKVSREMPDYFEDQEWLLSPPVRKAVLRRMLSAYAYLHSNLPDGYEDWRGAAKVLDQVKAEIDREPGAAGKVLKAYFLELRPDFWARVQEYRTFNRTLLKLLEFRVREKRLPKTLREAGADRRSPLTGGSFAYSTDGNKATLNMGIGNPVVLHAPKP